MLRLGAINVSDFPLTIWRALSQPWRQILYVYCDDELQFEARDDARKHSVPGLIQRVTQTPVLKIKESDLLCIKKVVNIPNHKHVGEFVEHNLPSLVPLDRWECVVRHAVSGASPAGLEIDLVVAKRSLIERVWELGDKYQIRSNRIILGSERFSVARKRGLFSQPLVAALVIALVLLSPLLLYGVKLHLQTGQIAERIQLLDASIALAKKEAEELRTQRTSIEQKNAAIRTLHTEKAKTPNLVALLETITQSVPDDAWLTQFQVQGRKLTIAGFGASAHQVINAMNDASSLVQAGSASPIVHDPIQKAERFTIGANIRLGGDGL